MEGTTQFHHEITHALLPQADPIFHNAATLDGTVDMLDPQPPLVERLVGPLWLQGQLLTAWLLRRVVYLSPALRRESSMEECRKTSGIQVPDEPLELVRREVYCRNVI